MNEFFDKTKHEQKAQKEFVFQQWRKNLCSLVVNSDVSNNLNQPANITAEQIRAVFNYGYKMAMQQTKNSLKAELYDSTSLSEKRVIEKLLTEVEDRIDISKCLVTFSKEADKELLNYAQKREDDFSRYQSELLSTCNGKDK